MWIILYECNSAMVIQAHERVFTSKFRAGEFASLQKWTDWKLVEVTEAIKYFYLTRTK